MRLDSLAQLQLSRLFITGLVTPKSVVNLYTTFWESHMLNLFYRFWPPSHDLFPWSALVYHYIDPGTAKIIMIRKPFLPAWRLQGLRLQSQCLERAFLSHQHIEDDLRIRGYKRRLSLVQTPFWRVETSQSNHPGKVSPLNIIVAIKVLPALLRDKCSDHSTLSRSFYSFIS